MRNCRSYAKSVDKIARNPERNVGTYRLTYAIEEGERTAAADRDAVFEILEASQ